MAAGMLCAFSLQAQTQTIDSGDAQKCRAAVQSYLEGEQFLGITDKTRGSKSEWVAAVRAQGVNECTIQRRLIGTVAQPAATATTPPEVNNENCKPDSIRAMPDNDNRKKFSGLCLRRGVLQKGPDQGLKM